MSPDFKTKAVIELAIALTDIDNANPDVGMGHGTNYFVVQAVKRLDLELSDINPSTAYIAIRATGR